MCAVNIVKWHTLVSNLKSLVLVSLLDDGHLTIVVEDALGTDRERFRFVFKNFFGYQCLSEEYRTALFWKLDGLPPMGWTYQVLDSQWQKELLATEPMFEIHGGNRAMHCVLCTEDKVIEVLAKQPPEITSVGSAPLDAEGR